MKKILAILLVLCMSVTLFACGDKTDNGGTPTADPNAGVTNQPDIDETKEWPEEIGFFDPTYDYSKNDNYKVAYLVAATSFLYDEFDKAFADWAKRMNINYTGMWAPAGGSADEYMSGIETFYDQGYDGFLLDADVNWYPTVMAKCDELGIPYISCMGQARDYARSFNYNDETLVYGPLLCPYVGFNQIRFGTEMVDQLVMWKELAYPDVPWDKVGLISVDYSLSPQLHERGEGMEMRWVELFPEFGEYHTRVDINPDNFFVADTSSGAFDQTTAQDLVTQILSAPSDIEVWLIGALFDDLAVGAANAAENLNLTDVTCVTCIGGSSLIAQWDAGIDNAWRYAQFTAQSIYAEPIIAALWSMMAGQATIEELWQDWVVVWDKGDVFEMTEEVSAENGFPYAKFGDDGKPVIIEEHTYSNLFLPTAWLDKDSYKEYLEWTDLYAYGEGADGHYNYEKVTDLELFSARYDSAPAEYQEYPAPRA